MQTLNHKPKPPSFRWGIPFREIITGDSSSLKWLLLDEERTALLSGNIENEIYSLPVCSALGINPLILNLRLTPDEGEKNDFIFTAAQARRIAPLLLAQSFIQHV